MDLDYGEWVRSRRAVLGLTQHVLAQASGVKQPLISAIESGRRRPTTATRAALDRALELRPSFVLERLREQVGSTIRSHGGRDAVVFGSVATRTDRPGSDLDLLVTFEEGRDIVDLLALEADLAALLTVPVDVVSAGSSGRVAERARHEAVAL